MTSLDPNHAARQARLWGTPTPKSMPIPKAPEPPPPPKMAAVKPDVIDRMIADYRRPVRNSVAEIIARVAKERNLEPYQVRGPGRSSPLVEARREIIWECINKRPDLTYPMIARALGGRDHSTIVHAIGSMAKRLGVPFPHRYRWPTP